MAKLLRVTDSHSRGAELLRDGPRSVSLRVKAQFGSMTVVNQQPKRRLPGPPHNPVVRELVEGKRRWSSPPKPEDAKQGFRGWHERGYLPHRDEPGLTQFVTFRDEFGNLRLPV